MADMSNKEKDFKQSRNYAQNEGLIEKSRKDDISGALGDTNENREIAPDNFYNKEILKDDEDRNERKKMYEKMSKFKKARARAIEANNKLVSKKLKNKLGKQHRCVQSKAR